MEMMSTMKPSGNKPARHGWVAKVLILVVSFLVFMECGARLVLSVGFLRRKITGIDDSSYRLQWIRLHRHSQEWTGPFAAYDPVRGWALKPGIRDMKVYDGTILSTNSKGIRGETEYSYARVPGKQRILLLGDSFTFGAEVPDEETYAHLLAGSLPSTEVLNLGVQGYGHDQMLLYLREEGVKYRPDIVMVGFTYIDVYRNIERFFAYAKPEFQWESGGYQLTDVPVPPPGRVLAEESWRPKSLDILLMLREKIRWRLGENEAEARGVTRWLLGEIAGTARGIGAVPVFVYLPVNDEIAPVPGVALGPMLPRIPEREAFLREICEEQSVPCLFLGPQFREAAGRGIDFHARGHYNAAGNRLAAGEIRDFLLRSHLAGEQGPPASVPAGRER